MNIEFDKKGNLVSTRTGEKLLSEQDIDALLRYYDKNGDGALTHDEIGQVILDLKNLDTLDPEIATILKKFDKNGDGHFSDAEILDLTNEIHIANTSRYAGYMGAYAGIFRYLAFTSDFGEALRPVVKKHIVTSSYAIAFGYCAADIAIEAINHRNRNNVTLENKHVSMEQVIIERTIFQGLASIALPYIAIHSAVNAARKQFTKMGRFVKWGPSVVGLCMIPFLPIVCDAPVEHGVKWVFDKYETWKSSGSNTSKKID